MVQYELAVDPFARGVHPTKVWVWFVLSATLSQLEDRHRVS
jgi:hypothetical protein